MIIFHSEESLKEDLNRLKANAEYSVEYGEPIKVRGGYISGNNRLYPVGTPRLENVVKTAVGLNRPGLWQKTKWDRIREGSSLSICLALTNSGEKENDWFPAWSTLTIGVFGR